MNRLWRVAAYEYRRNVFKKSFIFVLLSVPFFIVISIGMGLLMESLEDKPQPVGVVDEAGLISDPLIPPGVQASWEADHPSPLEFIVFADEEAAVRALEAGQLQVIFMLPADYLATRVVNVVYLDKPGENAWAQWWDILQLNLISGKPGAVSYRAAVGSDFIVRSLDGKRQAPTGGPTFGLLMPLFIALGTLFMVMLSAGYTMNALADEKENRTVEVLATSLSPFELIAGKILGIVAISLTLLTSWAIVIVLGVLAGRGLGIAWLNDLSMDWRSVAAIIAIAIPAYVVATALMVAVGAMVSSSQEGQSVSAIFIILHVAPLYVSWFFLSDPHSTLAVMLSLLPFTSLMTVGMRNLFTIVPNWQVVVSMVVQVIAAVGAMWLASRAYRLGMLRYGQRLSFRSLLQRTSREAEGAGG